MPSLVVFYVGLVMFVLFVKNFGILRRMLALHLVLINVYHSVFEVLPEFEVSKGLI